MARFRAVPAARHTSLSTFVHSDLERCTHVFLRQDTRRRALEPPYSGPYRVLSRRSKTLQLLARGRPVTVSTDMVTPAYTLNGTEHGNTFNSPVSTPPAAAPSATAPQPSRKLHAPDVAFISLLASTSEQESPRGGDDVGTSHKANRLHLPVFQVEVTLRLTVSQSVFLGVEPRPGLMTRY
jgi:hypothetical protein